MPKRELGIQKIKAKMWQSRDFIGYQRKNSLMPKKKQRKKLSHIGSFFVASKLIFKSDALLDLRVPLFLLILKY